MTLRQTEKQIEIELQQYDPSNAVGHMRDLYPKFMFQNRADKRIMPRWHNALDCITDAKACQATADALGDWIVI